MIKLYYHPISFPSLSPIFAAEAMGVKYEKEVVDLQTGQQNSPEYLAINPYGKVPAMQDGDFKMAESAAMMRYMARQTGSEFYPDDIQAQGEIDQWIDYINHHVRSAVARVQFNRFVAPMLGADIDEGSIQTGLGFLENNLPVIENQLTDNAFLCGEKMTLADIALVAALEPENTAKLDLSSYTHLTAWLKARRSEAFYTNVHSHFGAEMGV